MYLTKKTKEDLFKKHGKDAKDTGSAEGQIALFTHSVKLFPCKYFGGVIP